MKSLRANLLVVIVALVPLAVNAAEVPKAVYQALSQHFPPDALGDIAATPLPGLYQFTVNGQVFYAFADGRYVIRGRMIDLQTRQDLGEAALAKYRLSRLESIPESEMITFEAVGERRHTLTTFTDIDCPYCRKMHQEMAALNEAGIRVRYLLFPRAGLQSKSYQKAESVWCAKDRRAEMTYAKSGLTLEERNCPNPIEQHMALARELGLRGTPYTITDTGRAIGGYVPASELAQSLAADKQRAKP